MDLSIIIVNWKSKEHLRGCIRSIVTGTHNLEWEIIVIDSGSFDGCGDMLEREYPFVRFVQSQNNLGFAGANNAAFVRSTGEYVLFLNPDTEVKAGAVDQLYLSITSLPDAGIVGARLLNSDGSVQTSCIQAFPSILNQMLDAEPLRKAFPRSRLWGIAPLTDGANIPAEVDVISGACLMISRRVFQSIGQFSSEYFMYSEDVDLCLKAKRAGRRNYYVPSAEVVHYGGRSSAVKQENTFESVMLVESQWRFFRKTRSHGYGWLYRTSILAASAIRIMIAFALRLAGHTTGRSALRKWMPRLRWALGFERWVKNYGT